MNQILKKVQDVDSSNSEAVKDALSSFFQIAPKTVDDDGFRWLQELENVINRFPKFCMSHRNTVENVLVNILDCDNYHYVIQAAKCAHVLQQVRPSQEKTATPKTCWRDQMNTLCNAVHKLIGAVFPQAIDIYQRSNNDEELSPDLPLAAALSRITVVKSKSSSFKHSTLVNRLRNIFVFIQAMLVEPYPSPKAVRPQIILDVIVRALSVTSANNLSETEERINVAMVKTQALRTLDALVICLGPNLIPFSPLIFRFVMQTLKWSSENPSKESRKVRIASYASLSRWLRSLRCDYINSRERCWADDLTTHLIEDITPAVRVMQLQMGQPMKNLSKKAKRKLANTQLKESSIASHMPGEKQKVSTTVSDDVAIAALECVETFLTVCGLFLSPSIHKLFHERLVRECFTLSSYSDARALHLLRALDVSRKAAPPTVPPPTQYCLRLYSDLINSNNVQISSFCLQALLDIRLHLHCSPQSLNFSIEATKEKEQRTEEKKRISEKNRKVLEALLNNKNNESEEVITIADEPSRKKPRIDDDVADKISVSSASASIEISDESESEDDTTQDVQVILEKRQILETSDEIEIRTQEDEIDGNAVDNESKEISEECETETVDIEPIVEEPTNEEREENERVTTELTTEVEVVALDEQIKNIYEAQTQMPANSTTEMEDDETHTSMEVGYDYPNTGKETIAPLEKIEDENLPSTNETDDIQITCGQVVRSSQEAEEKKVDGDEAKITEVTKVNGVSESPTKNMENGVSEKVEAKPISTKNPDDVSVEEMLADFVDEVNEDTQVSTPA